MNKYIAVLKYRRTIEIEISAESYEEAQEIAEQEAEDAREVYLGDITIREVVQ